MKYEIPQDHLTNTIEFFRDYQLRLEAEAAALTSLHSRQAAELAQNRLKQAETAGELYEFYLHL